MKKVLIGACVGLCSASVLAGNEKVPSKFGVSETTERYIQVLNAEQVPVLDQNIKTNQLTGRQEAIIHFSSPLYGLTMGECHRGERKDAPLEARIWQDANNTVWLEYETPEAHVNEFGVIECGNEADKVKRALGGYAYSVTED